MNTTALTTTNTGNLQEGPSLTYAMFDDFISFLDVSKGSVRTYNNAIKQMFTYLQDNG